ncbi:MAG: Asp23/Gls24 family envelope stress response protein [Peptostreptococcales bacterium]
MKHRSSLGSINIDKHIIEKIVHYILKDFDKSVFLTNTSGQNLRMVRMLSQNRDSHYIEVKKMGEKVVIRFNVIFMFGYSMNKIASEIIKRIRSEVYNITDIEVEKVTIYIRGIKSKRMTKRNIYIEG